VEFSDDPIVPERDFDIEVKVRNIENSMEVWIYFDDDTLPFKKVNVGPDLEETKVSVPKDDWGVKLNLNCGTHTLKADLVRFGQVYDTIYEDFNVGDVPMIVFEPERPLPGEDVKIYFKDRDTEDIIKNLKVTITYMTGERESISLSTQSAGYVVFEPSRPGKYKIAIDTKKTYCGEMYFYAKRTMLVDGPHPADPLVGDMISIAVPASDIGVKAYDSNGDLYLTARTLITGAVNFTINDAGTYNLVIGETSTRYWGINKTLVVSSRPALTATIEPETPYVNSPMTVTVKAADTPLSNARVKFITPAGVQREYVTLANGKVIYDGVSAMGEYTVIVEKTGYEPVVKTFRANNGFQLELSPENPLLNEEAVLTVRDQDGLPVPDAEVSIMDTEILGATDAQGQFKFMLTESNPDSDPGRYTLLVMKDLFWSLNYQITAEDTFEITYPSNTEVGDDINVRLFNSRGGLLTDNSVSVKITSPDNTLTSLNKADFTFKPVLVGNYLIEANKLGYVSTSASIEVKPHPLDVTPRIDGKDLVIEVMSYNNSVEGISVSVLMFDGRVLKQITTDGDGMASVAIETEGNVTIEVNKEGKNPLYETQTTTKYIQKSYRTLLLAAVVAVIVAVAVALTYITWYLRTLKMRSDKTRFDAKGRSRLSGV